MKNKLFLIVIFFGIITSSHSQSNGKIIYQIQIDNELDTSKNDKYKFINSLEEVAEKFELKLIFNNDESFYELIRPLNLEGREEAFFKAAEIVFKTKNKFLLSKKNSTLKIQKDFGGELFVVEKKLDISDWKLVNEKIDIGGFTCYKAERVYYYNSRKGTSSIKQVVWYTPEIPFYYGPAEFCGFPGLVLSAKSGNIIYKAKLIKLNIKEVDEILPLKGRSVTEDEFKLIAKKARINLMNN